MKYRREFEIAYLGLKEGITEFEYKIGDDFFSQLGFQHPDFEHIDATVKLKFDKKVNFFMLHFDIDGVVAVICDRCADPFSLKLWDEYDLVVKLTSEDAEATGKEDDDDVVFIPRSETVIDVSEWIYEFIVLSIPIQRIHPANSDGSEGCNPEALKILKKMEADAADEAKGKDIWKGLDAIKGMEN